MNKLLLEFLESILTEAPRDKRFKAVIVRPDGERVTYFGSEEAKRAAITTGTHREYLPQYDSRLADDGEEPSTGKSQTKSGRIISGKDKTLQRIDSTKSKEFQTQPIPTDAEFTKRNNDFQIGPPPPPFKLPKELLTNPKIPVRHLKALERMMNTRISQETSKWSHFSDIPGGAGQVSAQAGELMTLISTTLPADQADLLFSSLLQHERDQVASNKELKKEGSRIVTKSWIVAAQNNRRAILNRLSKQYPGGSILAGAWDSQDEVESLGVTDYKKNKGYSTDVYFKIRTKDGEEILDEVSLKKSTVVNFLNSGTGKLLEWDPDLPDNVNPNVYSQQQRKSLLQFGKNNLSKLKQVASKSKELQQLMKSKKVTLEEALDKLERGKGSRGINKVVLYAIRALADTGNSSAKRYIQQVDKVHRQHQRDVIDALGSNKRLKQGMLNSIREEFPLKAVAEGEESMAIGPYSLDREILTKIFDTSNFDEIKEGLFAVTDEDPPYLAYRAGKRGRVIPIATIVAREDGVGYGGQIKFEMQLDKRFAEILKSANQSVYPPK